MNKYSFIEGAYDGYIWMSDEQSPKVLLGEMPELNLDAHCNPFVIEAQLYCKENNVSYSIRYVDGEYIINKYDLTESADYEEKLFVPARMPEIQTLKFRQYWKEENVKNCYNWTTLKPGKLVFAGFERKEEKK